MAQVFHARPYKEPVEGAAWAGKKSAMTVA
jgi:hypothetical protein